MANRKGLKVPINSDILLDMMKKKELSIRGLAKVVGYDEKTIRAMIKDQEMSLDASIMLSLALDDGLFGFGDDKKFEKRLDAERNYVRKNMKELKRKK